MPLCLSSSSSPGCLCRHAHRRPSAAHMRERCSRVNARLFSTAAKQYTRWWCPCIASTREAAGVPQFFLHAGEALLHLHLSDAGKMGCLWCGTLGGGGVLNAMHVVQEAPLHAQTAVPRPCNFASPRQRRRQPYWRRHSMARQLAASSSWDEGLLLELKVAALCMMLTSANVTREKFSIPAASFPVRRRQPPQSTS